MAQSESQGTNTPTPASAVLDKASTVAHSAVDRAIGAAQPAAQWIDTKAQRPRELAGATEEYVRENPTKALAIAFVAGIIVGRILL